jgi:hypothetical protein
VWPAWLALGLLNLGVLAVSLAPWVPAAAAPLTLGGRTAQALAGAAFALHAWPRVKPHGV